MNKTIIAVNYNSVNNLVFGGSSSGTVCKRLPQVCLTSQTRTFQTQTDLITNVIIERFTHNLKGEHAAKFSKILDILLSAYGRLEIDSNTLFVKFSMEKKFIFLKPCFCFPENFFVFSLSCFLKPPRNFKTRFQKNLWAIKNRL